MKVESYKDRGTVKHVVFALPKPCSTAEDLENPNDENTIVYMVRGMTPPESYKQQGILDSLSPPMPPTKQRTELPASGTDKLDARNLVKVDYQDINDPTFQEEIQVYKQEKLIGQQRAIMYTLMVCVDTFDLTDEQIKKELQQEAHSREPLSELLLRLDQLCLIIMAGFDQGHMTAIQDRINELSGVKTEEINFT